MDGRSLIELTEMRIAEDKRELEAVKKRLSRLPEEKIVIRHRDAKKEYYLITRNPETGKRKETYISGKDAKSLSEYCNREYCLELEPVLTEEIQLLEGFIKAFDPDRKYNLTDFFPPQFAQRFQPVAIPQKQKCRDWALDDYKRNTFPFDTSSMYKTENGEIVRSRAECLAANILYNLGIEYRYECILSLNGREHIYPDFSVMHPATGEIWYIEVFGMMGKTEYALDAYRRINEYAKSPYGNHVLFFFDYPGAPFDPDAFKTVIQKVFLA